MDGLADGLPVSFLPMKAVAAETGAFDLSETRPLIGVKKGYTSFADGDILFAKITPCMENGKVAVVRGLMNGLGFGSTEFHILRLHLPDTPPKLVFFYLLQERFRRDARAMMTGTAGQLRVPSSFLETSPFPLPPLPEQHRIVAKIEELFSDLDAGVEALKKTQALLKRYRQSVLKAAFEGKLTAEWRKAHKAKLEPASVLLERIREEGKKALGKKFKEAPPPVTTDMAVLPEGWAWARIDGLAKNAPNALKAGPFGSSLKKSFYVPKGYKIYGQEQVIRGDPRFGDYFIDEDRYRLLESNKVAPGDILISLVGTIGKVLILPSDAAPGIINPRLVKLSLDDRVAFNRFVASFLGSPFANHFLSLHSHGETMDVLNLKILRQLPIPLPSFEEQHEIVAEIERRFTLADEVERTVERSLKQGGRLRQSILKRAFEGRLVPQDPADEPAEKLLERIRAERAGADRGRNTQRA